MDRPIDVLLRVVRQEILKTDTDRSSMEPLTGEMQMALYTLAKKHSLAGLVGQALEAQGLLKDSMGLGYSDIGIPYGLRHKKELTMLKEMLSLLKSGIKKLNDIKNKNSELQKVINLLKYVNCCVKTFYNVKCFYEQRVLLKLCDNPQKMLEICKKIRNIATSEIANAKQSLAYLKKDSSLGYEASMGYVGGVDRVEWKIKEVNYMLDSEVSYYENQVKTHLERTKL